MINKDLIHYAYENWKDYINTITDVSKSDDENFIVSDRSIYNFDRIMQSFYPDSGKRPKSMDGLFFVKGRPIFVEFKKGYNHKVSESSWPSGCCDITNTTCEHYEKYRQYVLNYLKLTVQELNLKIIIKLCDTYAFLKEVIFPLCNEVQKEKALECWIVVDGDSIDCYESMIADLACNDVNENSSTNNNVRKLKFSVRRYIQTPGDNEQSRNWDNITVFTQREFEQKLTTLKNDLITCRPLE